LKPKRAEASFVARAGGHLRRRRGAEDD
jgi:hypothetical protein